MANANGFQFGDVFWTQDRMTGRGTGIHPWIVIGFLDTDRAQLCLRTTSLPPGSPGSVEVPAMEGAFPRGSAMMSDEPSAKEEVGGRTENGAAPVFGRFKIGPRSSCPVAYR